MTTALDVGLPPEVMHEVGQGIVTMGYFAAYFPIKTMLSIIGTIFLIEFTIFTISKSFQFLNWIRGTGQLTAEREK